eukprot:TRINITY_DN27485_c0_g1_i1.p1 TRINITY_DN27485_c0_g1~~TRINITY_DN27485_c0_g1_i1.p1  ORF type:complete len:2283 (-),score=523.16 TRINITY_DN27485_c0_g1_i1:218-7066(-)
MAGSIGALAWFSHTAIMLHSLGNLRKVAATSCEEVWYLEEKVGDGDEVFTCGERIVYLQTPQGGLMSETDARIQTTLEMKGCDACWPWEKYRQDTDTSRSSKRGIAIENNLLTEEALLGLSQIISWGCTWTYDLTGGPNLTSWEAADVDWIPMIWGPGSISLAQTAGLPPGRRALLGFNEPNFPSQASLTPLMAAELWKDIEQLAADHGIDTIIAPSMNIHPDVDPIDWLYSFIALCEGCKIDGIALHVFSCYGAGLKWHLDRYRVFGKPLWITEIACSDPEAPERLSAQGQMAYMKEAIPLLEADPDVLMYAWFSYFKDQWAHPIVDGENGDAGIIFPNGSLTPLGKIYDSFAPGSNLSDIINITVPPPPQNQTNETNETNELFSSWTSTTGAASTSTSATASSSRTGTVTNALSDTATASSTSVHTISGTATTTSTTLFVISGTATSSSTSQHTLSGTGTTTSTSMRVTSGTATETSTSRRATPGTATSTSMPGSSTTPASATSTRSSTASSGTSTTAFGGPESSSTTNAITTQTASAAMATSTTYATVSTTFAETRTTAAATGVPTSVTSTAAAINATMTRTTTDSAFTVSSRTLSTSATGAQGTTTTGLEATANVTLNRTTSPVSTTKAVTTTYLHGITTSVITDTTSTLASTASSTMGATTSTGRGNMESNTSSTTLSLPRTAIPDLIEEDNTSNESISEQAPDDTEPPPSLQLGGLSELEQCSWPASNLLAAMAAAALASAVATYFFMKQRCQLCMLLACCRRSRQGAEDFAPEKAEASPASAKWRTCCLPVSRRSSPDACPKVHPAPSAVLLPPAAVARNSESSPSSICEGTPLQKVISKSGSRASIALGTPVASNSLQPLVEVISKTVAADASLDDKKGLVEEAGLLLAGASLPVALRQEAEAWCGRQEERIQLAQSLEAASQAAGELEHKARQACQVEETPLDDLLSRVRRNCKTGSAEDREALLAEAARRASAFEEELESQRLRLGARRKKVSEEQSELLVVGEVLEERAALAALREEAREQQHEVQELLALVDGDVEAGDTRGGAWSTACGTLLNVWQQLGAATASIAEESELSLAEGKQTAKILLSDSAERRAALAEAARRAACFDEELQKQRQKLQKRKGRTGGGIAEPLELGRLLEDRSALEALKTEQQSALVACREGLASAEREAGSEDVKEWSQLLEAWEFAQEELANVLASSSETVTGVLPEGSAWQALAQKTSKSQETPDYLAMLSEAARRASVFDEELQNQRQRMKKRRKDAKKQAGEMQEPRISSVGVCHALADREALLRLTAEHAEASAQCQEALAAAQGNGLEHAAWGQLAEVWAQMQKDLAKAAKEANDATSNSGALSAQLDVPGSVSADVRGQDGHSMPRRGIGDSDEERRSALIEAARRVAAFDEELSKQRQAMQRRQKRTAVESAGADALATGQALLDCSSLQCLAQRHREGLSECKAALQDQNTSEAAAWEELVQAWEKLEESLGKTTHEAAAGSAGSAVEEAALYASGVASAARRAAAFERELHGLQAVSSSAGDASTQELHEAQRAVTIQQLHEQAVQGATECETELSNLRAAATAAGGFQHLPRAMACSLEAWQQLADLWQELGNNLESVKGTVKSSEAASTGFWRHLDASVSDSERRAALSEASRRAAQFDEELQRQRQRLARRKKGNGVGTTDQPTDLGSQLLALGDAAELEALASQRRNAAQACKEGLAASSAAEEAEGWKHLLQLYESLQHPLEKVMAEAATGQSILHQGPRMVEKVARNQKEGADSCLQVLETAICSDVGPLQELRNLSTGTRADLTLAKPACQVPPAKVQTWDVLSEAEGLLKALDAREADQSEAFTLLRQLEREAEAQLQSIKTSHGGPKPSKEGNGNSSEHNVRDVGCQTGFEALTSHPSVQRLVEELVKASDEEQAAAAVERWRLNLQKTKSQGVGRSCLASPTPVAIPPASPAAPAKPAAPPTAPVPLDAAASAVAPSKMDERLPKQEVLIQEAPKVELATAKGIKADAAELPKEAKGLPSWLQHSPAHDQQSKQLELPKTEGLWSPGEDHSMEKASSSRPVRRRRSKEAQSPTAQESLIAKVASASQLRPGSPSPQQSHRPPATDEDFLSKLEADSFSQNERHLTGRPTSAIAGASERSKSPSPAPALQQSRPTSAVGGRGVEGGRPSSAVGGRGMEGGRPSSAVGGRGTEGLLAPPEKAKIPVSPASSAASSASGGSTQKQEREAPRRGPARLDPLARPRGPPLPSAGRILLGRQDESPAPSRSSSPVPH